MTENPSFQLKPMLVCEKTRKTHWNYHHVTFKLAYIHKTINYVQCTAEVFLWQAWNKSQWTVLLGYPTVSKILAAIKHSAAEIILFFKQNSTSLHCACITVQLLQQKNSQFHCCWVTALNNPVLNPIDYKIYVAA